MYFSTQKIRLNLFIFLIISFALRYFFFWNSISVIPWPVTGDFKDRPIPLDSLLMKWTSPCCMPPSKVVIKTLHVQTHTHTHFDVYSRFQYIQIASIPPFAFHRQRIRHAFCRHLFCLVTRQLFLIFASIHTFVVDQVIHIV